MILKHRDRELLRFEWIEPEGVRILSVNDAERRFLPLEMKGEATDEQIASGWYLDASCELGLEKILTDETPVEIEDFSGIGSDGALAFRVRIDGKEVTSGYLAKLVEECADLRDGAWKNPEEGRVTVEGGTVRVAPKGDTGFLRISIPE